MSWGRIQEPGRQPLSSTSCKWLLPTEVTKNARGGLGRQLARHSSSSCHGRKPRLETVRKHFALTVLVAACRTGRTELAEWLRVTGQPGSALGSAIPPCQGPCREGRQGQQGAGRCSIRTGLRPQGAGNGTALRLPSAVRGVPGAVSGENRCPALGPKSEEGGADAGLKPKQDGPGRGAEAASRPVSTGATGPQAR